MSKRPQLPVALTIAGSDSGGGAGIQADLKTFTALGVYGASVITALTAQNTRGVTGIEKVPTDFIRAQFDAVTSDLEVTALKTGMLADASTVNLVAGLIRSWGKAPVVVDPVMVATSGDVLLEPTAIAAVQQNLLPLATVITPNLPEAATLLGTSPALSESDLMDQGLALLTYGCAYVLIKGGHGTGPQAVDLLVSRAGIARFERPWIETRNTHGTGCTLSAALTAGLAQGLGVDAAVERAKHYVWQALKSGAGLSIGSGHGPVDHVFGIARRQH
jgi:hydroxymethylpyrimidine/phosphomethylpyrimidine kinase